jgi:UDP-hydrolysing UDP-N-acetyl-D-glucosamine 2-epimerase
MRRICVVVGSRANYSSIKSALRAIKEHPALELQLVVGASALLDRYGSVVDLIERDGFRADARVHMLIEGETPVTMAMSTGVGLIELPQVFSTLNPDVVLTVADRFETMATTLAAAYMNIPVAHTQGGEVSGTVDESVRHAVTKFAHVHFPASPGAAKRIERLGEDPDRIFQVGCPRIDLVAEILGDDDGDLDAALSAGGAGDRLDLSEPFLLVSQHPVTTEYGSGEAQITETLAAVAETGAQAVVLRPNADAGSDDVARGIQRWREAGKGTRMRFFNNLPIDVYVRLLQKTRCLVGNSSSGIREACYVGTPVVNIGSRQNGREHGDNVVHVPHDREAIVAAVRAQQSHGPWPRQSLYGDGRSGARIADILARLGPIEVQKRITY